MKQGFGTQLRHLIDLLDGDVVQQYKDAGLAYRPRYTPVMRARQASGSASIGEIAAAAGISQPAATQTVNLMKKDALVVVKAGADGRQRRVTLSAQGRAMLPVLEACWAATNSAADELDGQLACPLSSCLAEAIAALRHKPFHLRLREARARIDSTQCKGDKA